MSVRLSLLAILDQGPCYGYQLRAEFDRRTGSTWPLNVGQIYNTLDRLERDGLVVKDDVDEQGHVYYAITDAGSAEVATWLASPVERAKGTRDELAIRVAVAATLPGVDVEKLVERQRQVSRNQRDELVRAGEDVIGDRPEDLARTLMLDAMISHADAELRWLNQVELRLARHPQHAMTLAPATERPRRGRPLKEPAAIA